MELSSVADRWMELHGSNNWEGLLQPLDPDLRNEVIRYGEFTHVLYDGLDIADESKFRYSAIYGKSEIFSKVGLGLKRGYNVTRYLYSTQDTDGILSLFFGPTEAVWMGYIAVSDDEETKQIGRRDIVVAFRGTIRDIEWIYDARFILVPFPDLDGNTNGVTSVHKGFLSLYNSSTTAHGPFGARSLRQQVMDELKRLLDLYQGEKVGITVLGHSLGGALATLCAYDIPNSKVNGSANVTAFTYASPKVGSSDFVNRMDKLTKTLRIVDRRDIVPMVPPPAAVYKHPGIEFMVDGSVSPYLKFANFWELGKPHNLEAYLHVVAGFTKYVQPPSLFNTVLAPVKTIAPLTTTILSSVFETGRSKVAQTTTAVGTVVTTVLPVDGAVKLLIGGNPEGQNVYDKLLKLFSEDLDTLNDFLLRILDIKPSNMGTGSGLFELVVDRDLALMNKSADMLKKEYDIPAEWWVLARKGMEQVEDTNVWLPRHKRSKDAATPDNPEFL